jgi:cell division protein FtsB
MGDSPGQHPSRDHPGQRPSAAERRVPLSNVQIILIALIVVGGRLVIDFSQRILEGQEKLAEQRELEAELDALLEEKQQLEAAKAYYSSPAFVEAWAHDQGKMVREGETLVIPMYDQSNQDVSVSVTPEALAPLPPWQVWWTLFFDTQPPLNPPEQLSP